MKFANCHDTLLAHHAFASHLPQRLDHVASCYTDSRPWKRLFKGGTEDEKGTTPDKLDGDTLCQYNASDAQLTMLSWLRMRPDLDAERAVYEHDRKLAAVCREMQRVGIGVDEERKSILSSQLEIRRIELRAEMCIILKDPHFAPGKLDHVRHALFTKLGASYVKTTPKGQASTANETLEGLRMSGNETRAAFATALLTWRLAGKVKSTYLDAVELHPRTRRAHYNWKPFGTVSGRLSCRLQSAPRYTVLGTAGPPEARIREIYVPRPGHTFVYYDVSQAEMRLAAFCSGDPVFMKACEGDVHTNNAKNVFPQAAHLAGTKEFKKYRDIAKNLGFAISYCAEAEKVYITLRSKGFDVSYRAVELILDKLRSAYRVYYRWVDANLAAVRRTGHLRSPFLGRIRWLGWYPKITDVANYPIQSGLADIVNMRTIELGKTWLGEYLVAQVHDACIYDVPKELVAEARALISDVWARPIDTAGGALILPIDLKTGGRWSDL